MFRRSFASSAQVDVHKPPFAHEDISLRELVVCSLEPWDEIWRRNQFFTDFLMRRNPALRVLFVEPAADILFDLWTRRVPRLPRLRVISADGRLRAFRPLKPLPRKLGGLADSFIRSQLLLAARALGFSHPTLWINDVTYAPLIARTGWPSLYDVTDDWLLAPFAPRELERLRRLDEVALVAADEVVVCSEALARDRGARRSVSLIRNAVDSEHFRRPRPRPSDLPEGLTAVYVGSLHDARIDVELVLDLARTLSNVSIVFVGPDSLSDRSRRLLAATPNVALLGPRPYSDVPAYLQHADVLIVPHRISPFTESLDPIKAYECLAVGTPTVATPVAGFRSLEGVLEIASPASFPERVCVVLENPRSVPRDVDPPSWDEQGALFEAALLGATSRIGS
jgi:teichuronic acid biosynthesis glycosyltransferase TuaH